MEQQKAKKWSEHTPRRIYRALIRSRADIDLVAFRGARA